MTLNDVMAALYCVISLNLVNTCVPTHNRVDLWWNLCTSLFNFVVRARCHRKKSSRSLSHLLMSFLYVISYVSIYFIRDRFILLADGKTKQQMHHGSPTMHPRFTSTYFIPFLFTGNLTKGLRGGFDRSTVALTLLFDAT